jgi:hypothetical protein
MVDPHAHGIAPHRPSIVRLQQFGRTLFDRAGAFRQDRIQPSHERSPSPRNAWQDVLRNHNAHRD